MTPTAILPLAEAQDAARCGGKAANLARLIAAGAPVPDGLVIPNGGIRDVADAIDDVAAALRVFDLSWTNGPLIVRSSAIGEDSADASFAGQLDSVADVSDAASLRAAIERVRSSAHSPRVIAYQNARGKHLAGLGIIIQRQVDAAVSGVLFTVSPTEPNRMLLEYCGGRGEALVSGEVNPGRIAIDRNREHGRHEWTELAQPDEPATASQLLLDDARISQLALLALDIERTFDAPQDIEWTIDHDDRLWIVQSRAITTLRRTAHRAPTAHPPSPTAHWSNANVNENFPQPISPLLYSIARLGYYYYFRNLGTAFGISERRLRAMEPALRHIIGVHGGRMYYNLTSIHSVLRSAPFGDLLAGSFNQFVGAEETGTAPATAAYRLRQIVELALIAVKTTWQYLFLTRRVTTFERTVDDYAARTHPDRLQDKPLDALLADFRGFLDIRCHRWKNASLADAGSMVCYGVLQRLLARAFPGRDQQALHNSLLKALPDLVSGIPPLKLWQLSRMIRSDAILHAIVRDEPPARALAVIRTDPRFDEFNSALHEYLDQWGFRCSAELMLTLPSFQETPEPVIELLKAYAERDGESPADVLRRQQEERLRETKAVMKSLGPRRASIVRLVLRWTQRSIQLRERARLKQALLYSRLRRVCLALGERLMAAGRIRQADDIFLLTAEELELLAAGGAMFPDHTAAHIALRREAHEALARMTPPDSIVLPAGEYLTTDSPAQPDTAAVSSGAAHLTGVGACGGSSRANAAILLDVTEAHKLTAGDILVTKQTDPGWGPLFPLISGLVIERGGMLSHGAIIAREFGIPSVVGVKDATRLIRHGAPILVDGNAGVVQFGEHS